MQGLRSDLGHVTRLFADAIHDAKTVQDLQGTTLDAVGLTGAYSCVAFVYHTCLDTATSHPQSGHEPAGINSAVYKGTSLLQVIGNFLPSGSGANDQSAVLSAQLAGR